MAPASCYDYGVMITSVAKLDFAIKTAVFEGPLELLIELVEKRKLLINDINLAAVTDEYIATVSEMQAKSLPHTAQFIQLAATLLLIKSKSLLPVLELTHEEEEMIDDLGERLRRYQVFRDAGAVLQRQFGHTPLYEPEYAPPKEPLFLPDSWCTLESLHHAMNEVLHALPKKEVKQKVQVRSTVSLEEMIDSLRTRIDREIKTSFATLRAQNPESRHVIVSFLAILEIFKQGNILITQNDRFADIEIELEQGSTPRYY